MKATGIVRRIDDLGRVVIPKEIRRTMRIREGDPLEIFTDRDGEVIFKKYSPIGELSEIAITYCDVLTKSTEQAVIICDRDHCIAAGGIPKKEVLERRITVALEDIMESRRIFTNRSGDAADDLHALEGVDIPVSIIAPIISAGDIVGAVVFLNVCDAKEISQSDIKLATVAASFLGKNMED
ncbi:MAG: AbrB/MazE/SpoVT family DNA-binding domain-containing protein [Clostridia bacterium]|nr:AbrB/MazE/SpoVT family DNA-binding domain-containing protein [Clostridia bacterium]